MSYGFVSQAKLQHTALCCAGCAHNPASPREHEEPPTPSLPPSPAPTAKLMVVAVHTLSALLDAWDAPETIPAVFPSWHTADGSNWREIPAALLIEVQMKDWNTCWHQEKCLLWDIRNYTLCCTWLPTCIISSSLQVKKAGDEWGRVSQEHSEGSRLSPCQAEEVMSCKLFSSVPGCITALQSISSLHRYKTDVASSLT